MSDYISRKTALTIFKQWDNINPNWTSSRVKDLLMYINAEDVVKAQRCKYGGNRWERKSIIRSQK